MRKLSNLRSKLPESGIRKLQMLASNIPDAIRLETGEPDAKTPSNICEAAARASFEGHTKYTAVPGYVSLRNAIIDNLKADYGLNVGTDEVIVTSGAVMAITEALLAIADPLDEILVPDPSWPVYEMLLVTHGFVPVYYHLNPENGFTPDLDELESKVTEKTKAIMINTPGNPTGAVFDESTIIKLMDFAVKNDLYVISDEVYDSIIFEGRHVTPKTYDKDGRVITIMGVSKKYAMTGWRIGYAIANKQIISSMNKIQITLVGNAASTSQKAAEEALTGPQDFVEIARLSYKERRDKVYALFSKSGIKAFYPKGAFYMLVDISDVGMESEEFALTLLREEKVSVAPGSTFGKSTDHMIRISYATEMSALLEGVSRICSFIQRNRKGL
jgi:Aspartate/tyrosine/aromatic aminotransferase